MKKANAVLITIIIMLVLTIIAGAGAYYFFNSKEESVSQTIPKDITTQNIQEIETEKKAESLSKIGPLYPLDKFTLNLISDQGNVYLLVKLDLELSTKELKNELDAKNAVIRDAIIRILTSKTLEDLSSDEGKERAIDEIINDLNSMLHDGYIKNIYITKFVIQ
jgi:flagellar FliL protein